MRPIARELEVLAPPPEVAVSQADEEDRNERDEAGDRAGDDEKHLFEREALVKG